MGYEKVGLWGISKGAELALLAGSFLPGLVNAVISVAPMSTVCQAVKDWLNTRYGNDEGGRIWEGVSRQYDQYLEEIPDYGGKKNAHALAIYGSIVIFSMYPLLPDHPPVEELQEFVTNLFMAGFVKMGKVFNLNRSFDMWLIDKVFHIIGKKDRKQYEQYPATFCNISEPYDKKNHAARYHFSQCPNAEFAKKYEIIKDENGYLVSRECHGEMFFRLKAGERSFKNGNCLREF